VDQGTNLLQGRGGTEFEEAGEIGERLVLGDVVEQPFGASAVLVMGIAGGGGAAGVGQGLGKMTLGADKLGEQEHVFDVREGRGGKGSVGLAGVHGNSIRHPGARC